MPIRSIVSGLFVLLLSACAISQVVPVAADTIRITLDAAPVCGHEGAQLAALRRAAMETISRGFDKFVILEAYESHAGTIGLAPITDVPEQSSVSFPGKRAINWTSHDVYLVVKMLPMAEPSGIGAVAARAFLGPQWGARVKAGSVGVCEE